MKICYLSVFKNSKNQDLNKCIINGKMGVRVYRTLLVILISFEFVKNTFIS